jgi:spore germination protein
MKKIMKALLIVTIVTAGCVQKEIVDDVNLETGGAYDLVGNKVRGTALIPVYLPDKAVENKTFTASSKLSRDFLRDVQRQSPDPIVTGSLEVVLFGERLSKKGILDLLDAFQRDASIGAGLYLAVTEGEAKNIVTGNLGERGNAIYISNLIRHNMKNKDMPKTNLQRFLFDFYQKGKSGYLPQLRKIGKDQIEISGISLFQNDHVVDTIPAKKMFFFKLLVDDYSKGTLKVNMGKEMAAVESIRSKYKMRLTARDPFTVNVQLKVKAVLNEYSGKLVTPVLIKKIEKKLVEKIEIECAKLIRRFQEKNIDPVGFGQFVKSQTRGFNFNKWENVDYQHLKVNVQADVSITESGVIE